MKDPLVLLLVPLLLSLVLRDGCGEEEGSEDLYPIIINMDGEKAVFIVPDQGCYVMQDVRRIERVIQPTRGLAPPNVFKTQNQVVDDVIHLCQQFHSQEINATQFVIGLHEKSWLIFPGTHYCGAGNDAANYTDLGHYLETDKCCRDHDYCTDVIDGWSCHSRIPQLCNSTPWTRSHCNCDHKFRECLQNANETASVYIGLLFFNVFGLKCFREEHPIIKCEEWGGFLNLHCQKYSVDVTKPKSYQFFDSPKFQKGNIFPVTTSGATNETHEGMEVEGTGTGTGIMTDEEEEMTTEPIMDNTIQF